MLESYHGPVRILGDDGVLLTTGSLDLTPDPAQGNWTGILETLPNTAVAGKALVVALESPQGVIGRAQLVPESEDGLKAISRVIGLGVAKPS